MSTSLYEEWRVLTIRFLEELKEDIGTEVEIVVNSRENSIECTKIAQSRSDQEWLDVLIK